MNFKNQPNEALMVAQEIIASIMANSNTRVEWIDGDEDRGEQKRLHINIASDNLLFLIEEKIKKIINQKENGTEKENKDQKCRDRERSERIRITRIKAGLNIVGNPNGNERIRG